MLKVMPSYARYALSALAAITLLFFILACTGAQGEIGAAGSLGPQGEQGSSGLRGAQGSEGPTGPSGLSASFQPIQEQVVGLQDQLNQLLTRAFVAPNGGASSLFEHRGATVYTVLGAPVFSGPPVEENGLTTVAGIVEVETKGTAVGHAVIDFTCVVGADGASNQCQGVETFEGTFNGKEGAYMTDLEWTSGGDAAFTAGVFKLVSGSGTGELEDLVKWEGIFQRDETAGLNGIVSGDYRFDAHRGATLYTVLGAPVFSGPPIQENGLTTVAGIVEIETKGTAVGHAAIDFTCVVGANGASNQCRGVETFEGTFNGKAGTYMTDLEWIAAGDAAFTAGVFKLVSGSGTGELEDLVKWEGIFQRDETAGLNGIASGVFRFSP